MVGTLNGIPLDESSKLAVIRGKAVKLDVSFRRLVDERAKLVKMRSDFSFIFPCEAGTEDGAGYGRSMERQLIQLFVLNNLGLSS